MLLPRYSGRHRAGPSFPCFLLLLGLAAILFSGCLPSQASFDIGFGTSAVKGYLKYSEGKEGKERRSRGIIVVYKYHHKFIHTGDGRPVVHPTAHLVTVGRFGNFFINVPSDVISMDILFIAPDSLTQQFHFSRQLGVGDITYRADLQPMQNWRNHYYTFLIPQLEHLIVEPRYRLNPGEQHRLSAWLMEQNQRLGGGAKENNGGTNENTKINTEINTEINAEKNPGGNPGEITLEKGS